MKSGKTKAFTLIELMFVIGLIGIVFFIAIPNYNRFRRNQASATAAMEFTTHMRNEVQWARQTEGYSIVEFIGNSGNYTGYSIQRAINVGGTNVFQSKKYVYMKNYMSTKILYVSDAGGEPVYTAWLDRGIPEKAEFYINPNEITFMGSGTMQDSANSPPYSPVNFAPGPDGTGYRVKVYVNCDVAIPIYLGN